MAAEEYPRFSECVRSVLRHGLMHVVSDIIAAEKDVYTGVEEHMKAAIVDLCYKKVMKFNNGESFCISLRTTV